MIQPEPEDLPKDNPKLEIAVLSNDVLGQRIMGYEDPIKKYGLELTLPKQAPVVVPLLPTLGQRIMGYEDPIKKYMLELTLPKRVQKFFSSLIGGVMLVLLIQSTNVLVGYVSISWPTISFSIDAVTLLKLFGEGLRFVGQGILTIANVALVEETLFRSWLPE
ncbi:hypothetical protein Tco_1254503 [Tanacetum coccineum]